MAVAPTKTERASSLDRAIVAATTPSQQRPIVNKQTFVNS